MNLIEKITQDQIRTDLPAFQVGDTIKVGVKINPKDGIFSHENNFATAREYVQVNKKGFIE